MTKTIKKTDLSSFTGRAADGTWNALDFKIETSISDEAFASLLTVGAADIKLAADADRVLSDQRKPLQEKISTIRHNLAVALLKRHPISGGDWLSVPVGRSRWTLSAAFPAVGVDIAAFTATFTAAGFKEANVRKIQERVLNEARSLAFERSFEAEVHAAIVTCHKTLARLSTETKGELAGDIWDVAELVWGAGSGWIPDATRAAIFADTMAAMEEKETKAAEKVAAAAAKAIAKSAKANSNTSPKVNGALVG